MNIQPIQNDNISMGKRSLGQRIWDAIPQHTQTESAKKLEQWKKIDEFISRPAENRGIMGATALLTQPAIDYYNNKVDEETRRVARNRTIAKIIAGASVGMFVVRGPIYKLITKMTDTNGKSRFSKSLLPKKYLTEIGKNEKFFLLWKKGKKALSTRTCAEGGCLFGLI